MKILLVKLSALESNDSASIRTLALANGICKLNHYVDYLVIPSSNQSNNIPIDKNINVIKTSSYPIYNSIISNQNKVKRIITNIIRKIYHSFTIYDYTYYIAKKINIDILSIKKYDIVISSSDPKTSHIAVRRLIKQGLTYKHWIQYWGDPMAIDITNKSIYPKGILRFFENTIIAHADKIVYVSPFTLDKQKLLFPKYKDKMYFFPIPYIDEKIFSNTNNKLFTIGYFGAYGSKYRNIIPLYNVCSKLKNRVELDIIGDSDLELSNTDNIRIYPRGDILSFEEKTDLFVCILNKNGTQIPGKIYHCAGTNRPVLVIVDGDNKDKMIDYLNSFNRFIICYNTEESITKCIEKIMLSNYEYKPHHSISGKAIAEKIIGLII